jgi:hypothetical protein
MSVNYSYIYTGDQDVTTEYNRGTEPDQVSKILCSLEYRNMDKAQKLSNPECRTLYSEPAESNYSYLKL